MYLLVMAAVWLVAGVAVLQMPQLARYTILGTHVSVGWLFLVMAAFNLVRWWRRRLAQAARQADQAVVHRPPPMRRTASEPDPNFDFTHPGGPEEQAGG